MIPAHGITSDKTSPSSTISEQQNTPSDITINIGKSHKILHKGQWEKPYDEPPGDGWDKDTLQLSQSWMIRAARMEKSCYQRSKRAVLMDRIMMVSYIILSTSGAGMAFFNLGASENSGSQNFNFQLTIVIGCIAMGATIFASFNAFFNFGARVKEYKYAANKFSRLVRKIEAVVHSSSSDRPPAKEFLQDVSEKYYKYQDYGELIVEEIFNVRGMKERIASVRRICELPPLNEDDQLDSDEEDINANTVIKSRLNLLGFRTESNGTKVISSSNLKTSPENANNNEKTESDCDDIKDIDFVGD